MNTCTFGSEIRKPVSSWLKGLHATWALVVLLACISFDAAAATGRTAGAFKVSSSGAATYTIPLSLPPGVAGIQPSLALGYNSQAGDGLLGVGWGISGLSAITRCDRNFSKDDSAGPPQLTAQDRFCLDGNRLRLAAGTYGADGSTYLAEIDGFSKVHAVRYRSVP
jgi:hypothetical protein